MFINYYYSYIKRYDYKIYRYKNIVIYCIAIVYYDLANGVVNINLFFCSFCDQFVLNWNYNSKP